MDVQHSGRRLIWLPALSAGQARTLFGAEVGGASRGGLLDETSSAGRGELLKLFR